MNTEYVLSTELYQKLNDIALELNGIGQSLKVLIITIMIMYCFWLVMRYREMKRDTPFESMFRIWLEEEHRNNRG